MAVPASRCSSREVRGRTYARSVLPFLSGVFFVSQGEEGPWEACPGLRTWQLAGPGRGKGVGVAGSAVGSSVVTVVRDNDGQITYAWLERGTDHKRMQEEHSLQQLYQQQRVQQQ